MSIPFGLLEYVNAPPVLRTCSICGATLEWNPLADEWADYEGAGRHYCDPDAIAALIPDTYECLACGCPVLVYQDGRRLNLDKTPHTCNRRQPPPKPVKRQPAPQPRNTSRYRGPVQV